MSSGCYMLPTASIIGTLSKHAVDDSENIISKCNFAFLQSFRNYSVIMLAKCVLTIPELNWDQRFRQFEIYARTRLEITATFLNNHRMNFQEIREKSWSGGNGSVLRAVSYPKFRSRKRMVTCTVAWLLNLIMIIIMKDFVMI